ncbi:MAG: cupin domain-containing protein [Woeseia sp.]|nr:cupin domain-containing protein [Woeseia sp.]NNE61896.1 cupin domain-containing protein [Woeseia sp.]NNL55535.1 cupin domain-containing protein [Woeseia sp.]
MKSAVDYLDWESVPLETVNPMMQRRIISGELMTVARIWFKDGFLVPRHSHHNEQITQVVSGVLRFRIGADGEEVINVGPGEVLVIPAHLPHEALCIGDVEEVDMWAPRREDWLNKSDDYLRQ